MVRRLTLEKALLAIGFSEPEAKLVLYLMENDLCSVGELIENTGLSRGTIYKNLRNLLEKGYVRKQKQGRVVRYSVTASLTEYVKKEFGEIYRLVTGRIPRRKPVESSILLRRICDVFQRNGYAIRPPSPMSKQERARYTRLGISVRFIDKIADEYFSLGISVLDASKRLEEVPRSLMRYLIESETRENNCLSTLVFVHTDRKDHNQIYRNLQEERFRPIEREPNYGIEDKPLYVFKTDQNIEDKTTIVIQEIQQRRIVTSDYIQTIKQKIGEGHELILLSNEHARRIDNLLLTKKPFERMESIINELDAISNPIQQIKDREMRNIGIFRRRFSEHEVRINQYMDAIERHLFLPSLSHMKRDSLELESVLARFKPLEYELNELYSLLFRYCVSFTDDSLGKPPTINPFIFTEPYEKDAFYVDQQALSKAAHELSDSILKDLPSFFQIIASEAGMGKTHAAMYIYAPIHKNKRIVPLYIDCPLNFDLISGVFQELTQESLFPSQFHGRVREMRRTPPSTARDFLRFLGEINDIWGNVGYEGVLLILDELENALPYTFLGKEEREYQSPLALRQLREILSQKSIESLGILVCLRSKIYPLLESTLGIENLSSFTHGLSRLNGQEFVELIEHRYQTWSVADGPEFKESAINKVIETTNGNTRDVIKYLRELFKFATRNDVHVIDINTFEKIGPIPLFKY